MLGDSVLHATSGVLRSHHQQITVWRVCWTKRVPTCGTNIFYGVPLAHLYWGPKFKSLCHQGVNCRGHCLELILQAFRPFTYGTAHSPTLPSLYLRHNSFSNPSVASPTYRSFSNPSFASPTSQVFTYVTWRGAHGEHHLGQSGLGMADPIHRSCFLLLRYWEWLIPFIGLVFFFFAYLPSRNLGLTPPGTYKPNARGSDACRGSNSLWTRTLDKYTRRASLNVWSAQCQGFRRRQQGQNTDKGHTLNPRTEIKIPDPARESNRGRRVGRQGLNRARRRIGLVFRRQIYFCFILALQLLKVNSTT